MSLSTSDSSSDNEQPSSYRLPAFDPEDPYTWFSKTERVFKALEINNDMTKFKMVIMALDKPICEAVQESIINHPPVNAYRVLKCHVMEVLSPLVWRNKRKGLLKTSLEHMKNKEKSKKKKRQTSSSSSSSSSSSTTTPPTRKRASTEASRGDDRGRRPRSPTPMPAQISPPRRVVFTPPVKETARLAVVQPAPEVKKKPVHERIGVVPQSHQRKGTGKHPSNTSHNSRGSAKQSSSKQQRSASTAVQSRKSLQQSKGTCQRSPSGTAPMDFSDCDFPPDNLCYYHKIFGKEAEKCKPDCKLWDRCRPQPPQQPPQQQQPQPPQQQQQQPAEQQKNVEGQNRN